MQDIIFDNLAKRFVKNIYGSEKGKIRLEILKADLQKIIKPGMQILDLGCGAANLSLFLALNNDVSLTCVEPSIEMLNIAKQNFQEHNQQATFLNLSYQDFLQTNQQKFDLILIHGVIEWLAEPFAIFRDLEKILKENAYLSLAFYNKQALIYRNLLKGHFTKINNNDFSGVKNSLTPQNPIDKNELENYLAKDWKIIDASGIRVFYDYMPLDFRKKTAFEEILINELTYRKHQDFVNLGRYLHWILQAKQ